MLSTEQISSFIPFLAGGAAVFIVLAVLLKRKRERKEFLENLDFQLLLIRIPQKSEKEKKVEAADEIKVSEQLFGILMGLDRPFVLEAAVPHIGEEIYFFAAVPKNVAKAVRQQIQNLWPGTPVEEGEDYNIFNYQGVTVGCFMQEAKPFSLPIQTYKDMGTDTFASLLGGLSSIKEIGEGAAIQVIGRPAGKDKKKIIGNHLESLRKGFRLSEVYRSLINVSSVQEAFSPPTKEEKEKKQLNLDQEAIKLLERKASQPLLEINFRVLASAPVKYRADEILDGIIAGFSQFSNPQRNEFRALKPKNIKDLAYKYSFRLFDPAQIMHLNTEELASVFHLPISSSAVQRIKWLGARESSPPVEIKNKGVLLGQNYFRGETKPIFLADDDRRRHVYIIGQTGTGKSTLITNMAADDIGDKKGIGVIDPHGDLVNTILELIPPDRTEDVVLFDPSDLNFPVGLNMLDHDPGKAEERTFIVNEMQGIFNKLFPPETMGPMFEQYMRNALLLLMEDFADEPATLVEVPRVFTDSEYRERKLSRIKNPTVIDFWTKEAVKAGGEASLANITPYITSKFNNFIANDYIRPVIGQPKSSFNFREIMDGSKILLVNLAKGKIGDINAGLLGMVFVGKLLMAALSRVDIPQEQRKDFNLFIDEFHNFTTDSISVILSEARKYRLNLAIAHQFIAQLTEKIRDSVFGNVGSIISFRVGVQDAEFLEKQFEPTFSRNDLINIDNFNAYAKMLVEGVPVKSFNIKTLPPAKGRPEAAEQIREISRRKYGRNRQEVEMEIYRRLRT